MTDFDERSGTISCATDWGSWYQTIDEVYIEIKSDESIRSKEVQCQIKPNHIRCTIKGETIIEGVLCGIVRPDDSTWTIEDNRIIRILLSKAKPDAGNCWKALLESSSISDGGVFEADQYVYDQMQRKLTLERFQKEQPGFDFSGAEISGNYQDGGPRLPI